MVVDKTKVSDYLNYLPAIFRQDVDERGVNFIGRFLLAFEKILSGLGDPNEAGLEEVLDRIHLYFDPLITLKEEEEKEEEEKDREHVAEFLRWLAGWVALSLRDDWNLEEKRRFISRIVPLYQKRGTKEGLKEILNAYTNQVVDIVDIKDNFKDYPPHYFRVWMSLGDYNFTELGLREKIARAIIEQEKPAHTYYGLQTRVLTMRINDTDFSKAIKLGYNSLLGTLPLPVTSS